MKKDNIIPVRTRITNDIERYEDIENQLKSFYSKDFFDKYQIYCFEYTCLEAEYLGLPSPGESLEERASFSKLCRFRTEVLMDELLAFTMLGAEMEKMPILSFAKSCEPEYVFPTDEQIKTQIKERYKGK